MKELEEIYKKIESLELTSKDLEQILPIIERYSEDFKSPRKEILFDLIEWIKVLSFLLDKYEKGISNISGEEWKSKNIDFGKLKRMIDELDENYILEQKIWSLGGNCFFKLLDKKEFIFYIYSKLKNFLKDNFKELGLASGEEESLSEEEEEFLVKIYIGQKINQGILIDFKGEKYISPKDEEAFQKLINKNLIQKITPYPSVKSLVTAKTLMSGAELSRKQIISNLESKGSELLDRLKDIPKKILGIFLCDFESWELGFDGEEFILDIDDFLKHDKKISEYSKSFCKILSEQKFAVFTESYVSTRGGRIDPKECVISSEVEDYLIQKLDLVGLSRNEKDKLELSYTLFRIKEEIIGGNFENERKRNDFWEILKNVPFDESAIKEAYRLFEEKKIITPYRDIKEDKFLFEIINEEEYIKETDRVLASFVDSLISSKVDLFPPYLRGKNILKLHSEMFKIIGEFEILIRNGLIADIKIYTGKKEVNWEQFLKGVSFLDKLKKREKEDIESGMIPEKELIFYADILDYKKIFSENWKIFGGRFTRKNITCEVLESGLLEINRIRRKVMHLRDIKSNEASILKMFIIPRLRGAF